MTFRWDFSGKSVLVTGVARAGQIGHAVAHALGKAGACLVAVDKNAVAVAERVKEFAAEKIEARPAAGDLTPRRRAELFRCLGGHDACHQESSRRDQHPPPHTLPSLLLSLRHRVIRFLERLTR